MKTPTTNCYWALPNKILAGEYPRDVDEESSILKISSLLKSGVRVFIDLTEEDEGLLPYSTMLGNYALHKRFPIRDVSVPAAQSLTIDILDTIDTHIEQGEMIYIHCWGGIGRTGTIIGCWLARHGLGGKHALMRLRELWEQCPKSQYRRSPETDEQERYIMNWETGK